MKDVLQEKFDQETLDLTGKKLKAVGRIGVPLFLIFGFLDYFISPEKLWLIFILRLICSSILAVLYYRLDSAFGRRHLNLIGITAFLSGGLTIDAMVYIMGGGESPYYAGLSLVILTLGLLMPWRLQYSLITCFVIYVGYFFPSVLFHEIRDPAVLINNNFFLLATIVVALAATYAGYQLRYQEFMAGHQLEEAKDDLEKTHRRLVEAQSDLVHAEKMAALGQLVAGVAHEINNPVAYSFLTLDNVRLQIGRVKDLLNQMMVVDPQDESQVHALAQKLREMQQNGISLELFNNLSEAMDTLKEGLHRTKEIVANLKTFAQKDRGNFVYVNLHECLDSTLKLLTHEMGNRIAVHKEYGDIPEVQCLPGQLNQVFMNFLHNATMAIEKEGDIWIKTEKIGDHVRISVKDNGRGMTPEVKGKIFDPFFTTREVGKGTGLGLSISDRIIQNHGGTIRVESEPGKGAEFIIVLPIQQPLEMDH